MNTSWGGAIWCLVTETYCFLRYGIENQIGQPGNMKCTFILQRGNVIVKHLLCLYGEPQHHAMPEYAVLVSGRVRILSLVLLSVLLALHHAEHLCMALPRLR